MISKREIFFFIALFAAGIIGAWKFVDHLKAKNNTPEKVAQRIINQSLQEDFKRLPQAFKEQACQQLNLKLNRRSGKC
jgi:hypothetical protein